MRFLIASLIITLPNVLLLCAFFAWRCKTPKKRLEAISHVFGVAAIICALLAVGTSEAGQSALSSAFMSVLALSLLYGFLSWGAWQRATRNGSNPTS